MTFDQFITNEKKYMTMVLTTLCKEIGKDIENNIGDYLDQDCQEPSIDVRLCIDIDVKTPSWIFRTGCSDYDPVHSEYCAASCIGIDENAIELLEELLNQLDEV